MDLRRTIAGVSIVALAEKYGTPLYVYDLACIDRQIDPLRRFDTIRYAQKANGNLSLLRHLRARGVWVDAVSAGEIARALAAGYSEGPKPPEIVYTADVLTADSLAMIRRHRLRVNCGSIMMIRQLADAGHRQPITIRVNPGFGHGHHAKTNTGGVDTKHGIWHGDLDQARRWAEEAAIPLEGIHMHIGSGADFAHLARVCGAMEQAAMRVGPTIDVISTGGGLPVPYRSQEPVFDVARFFDMWNETRATLEQRFGHAVRLEVEPGRFLVAQSGYLIAELRSVNETPRARFYLLDAGFQTLVRPAMYGAFHPISVCPRDEDAAPRTSPAIVAGPLCESGDVFTQCEGGGFETRDLPDAQVGDLFVLEVAGAYGMSMASNYNSYPLPAEVCIQDGQVRPIRRRQTVEEMLSAEMDAE